MARLRHDATGERIDGEASLLKSPKQTLKGPQGWDKTFRQVLVTCDSVVLETSLRITGSTRAAAEIYRKTFLRGACVAEHSLLECSFRVWIFRQMARLCLDYLAAPIERVVGTEDGDRATALSFLTPIERMIVELKLGQGFPLTVVEEILEIPRGSAREGYARAIAQLRSTMGPDHGSADQESLLEEVT